MFPALMSPDRVQEPAALFRDVLEAEAGEQRNKRKVVLMTRSSRSRTEDPAG